MLQHVEQDAKAKTLREARRVLKPGGSMHVLDFAGDASHHEGLLARVLHPSHHERSNFDRIPALMHEAGFASSSEVAQRRSVMGRVAFYAASVSDAREQASEGASAW